MRRKKTSYNHPLIWLLVALGAIMLFMIAISKATAAEDIRVEFSYVFYTQSGEPTTYHQEYPVGLYKITKEDEADPGGERYLHCTIHLIPREEMSYTKISFNGEGFPNQIYVGDKLLTIDSVEEDLRKNVCSLGVV